MGWYGYGWRPYVPVAARRARAFKTMDSLRKKGRCIQPVKIDGRTIARSFWGRAWCEHLEKFSDYENRLPRGRAYVRNGSVCHLEIAEGAVKAMVSGSELYNVSVEIKNIARNKWDQVRKRCAGQIGSLLELLRGSLSKGVMAVVTDRDNGLFPLPGEIKLHCSCPDWAVMCKHVAAVLYGVGARLDEKPELLFRLRGVDHEELIGEEVGLAAVSRASDRDGAPRIAEGDLSHLFGIEMAEPQAPGSAKAASKRAVSAGKTLPHQRRPAKNGKERVSRSARVRQARKEIESSRPRNNREQEKAATHATPGRPPEKPRRKTLGAAVAGTRPVTGKAVSKLRVKFDMTQAQFARLLGVSRFTVANWEKAEGPLNLRATTRKAWNTVSKLNNTEAWQRIRDTSRRSK